ncbi:MAG: nucleoside hydrolase [Verrucomicrobia bacterium]|nr:nucleoside hydrolase [Verrucomicrobiota bacterium]
MPILPHCLGWFVDRCAAVLTAVILLQSGKVLAAGPVVSGPTYRPDPAEKSLEFEDLPLASIKTGSTNFNRSPTGLLLAGIAATPVRAAASPVNLIFDTDMGGDCDDVGALFVLHGAVERGEAKLLATMGCVSADAIAPALDAINTWFGRPEIPVGTLKDPGFLSGPHFTSEIAKRFPHKYSSGRDYPDAVNLYRQLLAQQPDGSVVVLAVGPLRNLANLLKSRPDDASPLDGVALVARKVQRLEVMGGNYPPSATAKEGEWNFQQDPAAAALVCSTWPTPVLFNGEGGSTMSGRRATYEMPEHNPLTMAYRHYPGVGFAGDRLSWDPISCLVTVRGAAPWFKIVSGGVNVTDATTGMNFWKTNENRNHSYLVLQSRKSEVETALEDMMVAGKGRPTSLTFNTAYYADAGMAQITASGAAEASVAPSKAFDQDEKTGWLDQAASSWIQCQYVDGRKARVTSYVVVCRDPERRPRTLELLGSNDGGSTWTRLDWQEAPAFSDEATRREFPIAQVAKFNLYRLRVTAADNGAGVQIATLELNEAIHCRPEVAVAHVTLDQSSLHLAAHSRATLNATLAPRDTFERDVSWSSSNPAVAEVRRIGEQTAIVASKRPGTCTITATIGQVRQSCAVTVTPTTLPMRWSFDELDAPPIPGSVSVSDRRFTLTGCGHAMTGFWERRRDQGAYVSRTVPGEATISARLISLAPNVGGPAYQWDSRPSTAAGVMLRESLTEGCGRYALLQIEATGQLVFGWRDKIGPDESHTKELGKVTLPIHLKLTRTERQIHIFTSTDGQSWGEPLMTHTTTIDGQSRLGLFTCSGNTFASTTAVFESVSVH